LHLQRQQQRAVLDSGTPTYTHAHTHPRLYNAFFLHGIDKKRRIEFQKKKGGNKLEHTTSISCFCLSLLPCPCCCPCPFAHRFGLIQLDLQRLLAQIVLSFVWHRWTPVTAGPFYRISHFFFATIQLERGDETLL